MQKKVFLKNDLTKKFLLFSILPSLFLSIALVFFIINLKENTLAKTHIQLLKNIDYKLQSFYKELESIEKIIKDSHIKEKNIFNNVLKFKEYISSIVILNKDGSIKKIITSKELKNDYATHYKKDIDLEKITASKQSFLGDVYFFEATNEAFMPYVFKDNQNIYILNINLEFFNNYIKSLVGEDDTTRLCIVDKNGLCLVNSLDVRTVKNQTSFYDTAASKAVLIDDEYKLIQFTPKNSNETSRLTYANQKETGWKLVVKDETDKIYSVIEKIIFMFVVFMILLIFISIITAKRVSKNIVLPLESLTIQIQEFANDLEHTDTTEIPKSKYYIFTVLIESFLKMKNDIIDREMELKSLNEHLEERIEEKTAELANLNKNLHLKVQEEIEQNKTKEKLLFEQSKMASMGEMIGNIAHQWRQPLSLISTVASAIIFQKQTGTYKESKLEESMDKIVHTTQFLSQTIDDFRNFFKDDKEKTTFTIQMAIDRNTTLIESSFKEHNISLDINLTDVTLYGFQNELIQGILNILNNAKDAFIEHKISYSKVVKIKSKIDEERLILTIHDNAGGIPAHIISRIFEPYFTTKHMSQGTGIGLYMTREIIVTHMEGELSVENQNIEVDDIMYLGAIFTIKIPLSLNSQNKVKTR